MKTTVASAANNGSLEWKTNGNKEELWQGPQPMWLKLKKDTVVLFLWRKLTNTDKPAWHYRKGL